MRTKTYNVRYNQEKTSEVAWPCNATPRGDPSTPGPYCSASFLLEEKPRGQIKLM